MAERATLNRQLALTDTHCSATIAMPFEHLDGCKLIANKWNDGDSFHVRTADGRD